MTVLVKTESSVKKLVWVPDGYINRRPPTTGGESVWGKWDFSHNPDQSSHDSIQSKRSSPYSGGRRPNRPSNGGDNDPHIDIVYIEGYYIIISITGPVVVG